MQYKVAILCLVGFSLLTGCSKEQANQTNAAKEQVVDTLNLDHEDIFTLKVGSCFNEESEIKEGELINSIPIRQCNEPHQNEVFFIHNLADADTLPSTEQMEAEIKQACMPAFEKFIGMAYDESEIEMGHFTPSAESWANGDRELVCYVSEPDLKMISQSLKNAKR